MTLHWFVTGASLVVAVWALWRTRRIARRLEQLSQLYWELKYLNGDLRVKLQALTGDTASPQTPTPAQGRDSFVPLSSLKR